MMNSESTLESGDFHFILILDLILILCHGQYNILTILLKY